MKTSRFICFQDFVNQKLSLCCTKMRLLICFLILLWTVGTVYSSPKVDEIGTSIEKKIRLVVDKAPFLRPDELKNQDFIPLQNIETTSEIGRTNTRYWIKIPAASNMPFSDERAYYYFGDFGRILVYQYTNGAPEKIIDMGYLYKKPIKHISPHFNLLPVNILDRNKEVYVQLSSGFHMNASI